VRRRRVVVGTTSVVGYSVKVGPEVNVKHYWTFPEDRRGMRNLNNDGILCTMKNTIE